MIRQAQDLYHKLRLKRRAKVGQPPGTMVFVGDQKTDATRIDTIVYDADTLTETTNTLADMTLTHGVSDNRATWISVNGIHNLEPVEQLGKLFNLHPLTMEDIVNTAQRPKVEFYPDYIYVVLKNLSYGAGQFLESEHLSLVIGKNWLLSFQESGSTVFDTVREWIRVGRGRIRTTRCDYLAYVLMDTVVDNYLLAVERLGDHLETLEEAIFANPQPFGMENLHHMKRTIITFRKAIWPLREGLGALERGGTQLIAADTTIFLRDLYDHTIQIMEMVETFRDILSGIHEIYLSAVSNRMNEVMKVLTIIATIFIPMTLISSIYGMNFEYMPELRWRWGYFATLGAMLLMGGVMAAYFKRKKWL